MWKPETTLINGAELKSLTSRKTINIHVLWLKQQDQQMHQVQQENLLVADEVTMLLNQKENKIIGLVYC
jgi:hypothetical protein